MEHNSPRYFHEQDSNGDKDNTELKEKTSTDTTLVTPDTIMGGRAVASNEVSGGKYNTWSNDLHCQRKIDRQSLDYTPCTPLYYATD